MGAPTYQVEDYLAVLPEMKELLPEHWEEMSLDRDIIKLEPAYDKYETMAKAGLLHMVTMRVDGELGGYYLSIVCGGMHYASVLTAHGDFFFIRKKYRGGKKVLSFFKFLIESLWARGVKRIYTGTKVYEGKDIGKILEHFGFIAIERKYMLTRRP